MIELTINGDSQRVADGLTLEELLARLELQGRRLAVEVNEEIVPRSQYPNLRLSAGDRIEIVHAIGGGQPVWEL